MGYTDFPRALIRYFSWTMLESIFTFQESFKLSSKPSWVCRTNSRVSKTLCFGITLDLLEKLSGQIRSLF